MQYVHIKNIDQYNPGYQDRKHIWAKIYWDIFVDEAYQNLTEIDRHRLISLIVFETYTQKPVPLTPVNMTLMGWETKKRPILLTIQMLHTFIEVRNENVTQSRVEKSRVEKSRVEDVGVNHPNFVKPLPTDTIDYIILDLNNVLGSSFKPASAKTRSLIHARLGEGFTQDDFKAVHRQMKKEWGMDEKMAAYLRPETLYSNKFEGYLQRAKKSTPKSTGAIDEIKGWDKKERMSPEQMAELKKMVSKI